MSMCNLCNQNVSRPCFISSPDKKTTTAVVAPDQQLMRQCKFQSLAMGTKSLGISRREIPNFIADTIFNFGGPIIYPDGKPYKISDTWIDDAFRNDGSFRWLSDFIGFAGRPPMQTPQKRVLERLRLIDLAFRLQLSPG